MMPDEEDVRVASARFYEALNQVARGDLATMADTWHQTDRVTTAHPLGEWAYGWEQVWASWEELSLTARNGTVIARDLRIFVYDSVAYTTCVEDVTVSYGETLARWSANVTNVFYKSGGAWKLVHHHSDKAPAAEDAVQRMVSR
jgi:ketosteroid isomerase-like protein